MAGTRWRLIARRWRAGTLAVLGVGALLVSGPIAHSAPPPEINAVAAQRPDTGTAAAATSYPCGTGWPGVYGAIGDHYYQPGIGSSLGCPVNWEYSALGPNRAQDFQAGLIWWWAPVNGHSAGTFATWGDIAWKWRNQCGGIYGVLGPPDSDEYWAGNVRRSVFFNGYIDWNPQNRQMVATDWAGRHPC